MNQRELIGREASVRGEGRRRTRGYVAESVGTDQVLFVAYGDDLLDSTEIVCAVEDVRVLKSGPPTGWRAIDVLDRNDEIRFSLRVRPHVIGALEKLAEHDGETLDWAFNELLRQGLAAIELSDALQA